MALKKLEKPRFLNKLFSDRMSGAWKLLSETSNFLSRTDVFAQYEEELRAWRHALQTAGNDGDRQKQIREEIIELRKALRLEGYDLSLASQSLVLDGFRNDASIKDGFRRLVVFFCDDEALLLTGEENHITLAEQLERQLETRVRKLKSAIRSKHYLWYLRKGDKLILSGSDTETKEDFERLKVMSEANSLRILSSLKSLK